MHESLDERGVLTEEQKEFQKGAWGTSDLIFIDKTILKEAKRRRKNLALCWLEHRKAYSMAPHLWIMECLTMFKIANNVQNLLQYAMFFGKSN